MQAATGAVTKILAHLGLPTSHPRCAVHAPLAVQPAQTLGCVAYNLISSKVTALMRSCLSAVIRKFMINLKGFVCLGITMLPPTRTSTNPITRLIDNAKHLR